MQLGQRAKTTCVALLLGLAVALVYVQCLSFRFINLDDGSYVENNRYVTGGINVGNVIWAFTHRHASNWHPLTWLSHMVDSQLFGSWAGGHHGVNMALHAINAMLLLIVMARLTGRFWPSALTAAIFAVHPLRVESVAWVSERKDLLSGFFFMLTLLAYQNYVRRRLPGMLSVVALFFACGLMSKPMVVTLPAVLLLLDYWPLDRVRKSAAIADGASGAPPRDSPLVLVIEKIPLFILAAVSCVITMWAQHQARELNARLAIVSRLQTAVTAYWTYLVQAFWPVDLSPFYPVAIAPPPASRIYIAVAGVVVVGLLTLLLAKKRPYLITGWLWFLGMLIPVIGVVPVGGQSHADRYSYLPHIGIYMAVSFALADLWTAAARRRFPSRSASIETPSHSIVAGTLRVPSALRAVATVAVSIVLAMLAVGAWRQAAYWSASETLWRRALAIDHSNHLAHSQLGDLYYNQKNLPAAKAEFEKSLQTGPKNEIARMGLGAVLAEQGQTAEAEKQFRQVIADSPNLPNGYIDLGELLNKKHDYAGAIECLQKALQLQPDDEGAHITIAIALRNENRLEEAIRHELIALQINPQSVDAHRNLANLLASIGNRPEAVRHYYKALEIAPNDVLAGTYLAWLLATAAPHAGGNPREAIRLVEPLCQSATATCEQLDALAAAYAGVGRFDEAQATAARAKALALSSGNHALADGIEARRKLYAGHKPFYDGNEPATPPPDAKSKPVGNASGSAAK